MAGAPRPTVFVLMEPRPARHSGQVPDLSAMERFGKIEFLIPQGITPEFKPYQAALRIDDWMKLYDPHRDFVTVAGGSYIGTLIWGVVMRDKGFRRFAFLRFEREQLADGSRHPTRGHYVPIIFDLDNLASGDFELMQRLDKRASSVGYRP